MNIENIRYANMLWAINEEKEVSFQLDGYTFVINKDGKQYILKTYDMDGLTKRTFADIDMVFTFIICLLTNGEYKVSDGEGD